MSKFALNWIVVSLIFYFFGSFVFGPRYLSVLLGIQFVFLALWVSRRHLDKIKSNADQERAEALKRARNGTDEA